NVGIAQRSNLYTIHEVTLGYQRVSNLGFDPETWMHIPSTDSYASLGYTVTYKSFLVGGQLAYRVLRGSVDRDANRGKDHATHPTQSSDFLANRLIVAPHVGLALAREPHCPDSCFLSSVKLFVGPRIATNSTTPVSVF